ncbi:MAG: hypothetical protein RLZZ591_2112 [Pseudomonadota bacterium]|jgi:phospholipid/cholesterol/gamma-HCH transport system permease protein
MHAPPDPGGTPRLKASADAAVGHMVLLGQWTAHRLAQPGVFGRIQRALQGAGSPSSLSWDLRELQRLDHTGAQMLWNAWGRQWPTRLEALPAQKAMLERVARYSVPLPTVPTRTLWTRFLTLGENLLRVADHLRDLTRLVGELAIDTVRLLGAPRSGPWRDVAGHIYRIGATALPVTALVGFMIGVVLAYLMAQQFVRFGADGLIVDVLGLAVIRELGPMLAAILVAGRTGSAITAQIGVMRVTEELDAMRVMGIAPVYRLVMPRAIALAVVQPLIGVWTTAAALLGGMLAADWILGITPLQVLTSLPLVVKVSNLYFALGKSMVFGALIAVVGCHFGLRVKPDTESLGQGTTASVVAAITAVLLANALFAVLFKQVGMW